MRLWTTSAAAVMLAVAATAAPARSQTTRPPQPQARTSADPAASYYHFMLGRHFESRGDVDRAIAEHRQAARLDPDSAEIRAEIAALLARQGRVTEAMAEARAALAIDAANLEANRVLGGLLAASIEGGDERTAALEEAIQYLERGRRTDGIDTDTGLELTLARLYARAGRHDAAVALLGSLVEREPVPEAYLLLAQSHTSAGRAEQAVAALEIGAAFDPRLLVSLGELMERQQRWDRAAAAYERAAGALGDSAEIAMRWAGALLNLPGRDAGQRAVDVMRPIAAARPADDRAQYLLAQAQRKAGDLEGAEATARRLLEHEPQGFWGAYALAQVLQDRGDHRGIVAALAPLAGEPASGGTRRDRQRSMLLTQLGFAHLQLGQAREAARVFERGRASGDAAFETYLLQAQLAGREFDRALELARTLRASRPGEVRLAQLEARALAGLGRVNESEALLRELIARGPEERSTYLILADVLSAAGRHADAARTLDEAASRFPGDLSVLFQQGAIRERAGDPARAEASFRAVIDRDPRHAPALNYLGYMFAERGERLDEAVSLIRRALDIEPGNGSYLDSLGWAYYRQGRLDAALEYLARAADRMPRSSVVQDHYGDVLAALGRAEDARAAWRRALDGDGEGVDAASIQRKIAALRDKAAR